MELDPQDFWDRKARQGTPQFTDEDARLVKLYEREGWLLSAGDGDPCVVDPEGVAWYGEQELVAEEGAEAPEPGKYEGLSYAEVREQAKNRGLNAGGTHEEIVARLDEHDQKQD
ncbi:hypothetical protein UK23_29535 [Lentzea aerocolonigenes]|uniref:SAP domain-containing protein n=1 Tax=Lentzea aerocolonigenes TaxID=68170 RepID=A0A0F0GSS3_LENAE|nr:SAP domain-containing protein [Lentzea aerocolonigenes]KJK44443.1 hypothetical protein UK23_29535 [Lentzea aerocolonigenes]